MWNTINKEFQSPNLNLTNKQKESLNKIIKLNQEKDRINKDIAKLFRESNTTQYDLSEYMIDKKVDAFKI